MTGDVVKLERHRVPRLSLLLPLPPSTNQLYRNVRGVGRVKTKAYKTWCYEAGHLLNRQSSAVFLGPVAISVIVRLKGRVRDLDNLLKAPLDLIGPNGHGIIRQDSSDILQELQIRVTTDEREGIAPGWMRLQIERL